MSLREDEREDLEDAIYDASMAATKYLETGKEAHRKFLEMSVADALEYLTVLAEPLKNDEKLDNYKLHMMVPLQLIKFIQMKEEEQK